jgi:hypothetical protein
MLGFAPLSNYWFIAQAYGPEEENAVPASHPVVANQSLEKNCRGLGKVKGLWERQGRHGPAFFAKILICFTYRKHILTQQIYIKAPDFTLPKIGIYLLLSVECASHLNSDVVHSLPTPSGAVFYIASPSFFAPDILNRFFNNSNLLKLKDCETHTNRDRTTPLERSILGSLFLLIKSVETFLIGSQVLPKSVHLCYLLFGSYVSCRGSLFLG